MLYYPRHVGLEEEVRNVEDQFLNEVYTPDFLLDDRDACIAADTASNNTTVDLTKTADVLTDSDTCISNKGILLYFSLTSFEH